MPSPVLGIARVEQISGSSRPRTYAAIAALEEAGVIEEVTGADGSGCRWPLLQRLLEAFHLAAGEALQDEGLPPGAAVRGDQAKGNR
jgi:hypothetical protein